MQVCCTYLQSELGRLGLMLAFARMGGAASSACTGVLLGLHNCDTAVQADEWLKLMFCFSSTVTPPGEQPSFAHHLLHCPGSIFDMPTAYHHFLSIIGVSKDRIVHLCKPVQSIISLGY